MKFEIREPCPTDQEHVLTDLKDLALYSLVTAMGLTLMILGSLVL